MIEEFETIPDTDGRYMVSKTGVVVCNPQWVIRPPKGPYFKDRKVLRQGLSHKGYRLVGLFIRGKLKTSIVHRLVAKQWIPNPDNKPEVNHKNGIKTDNRVENLEWMTTKENCIHASSLGLYTKAMAVTQYDADGKQIETFRSAGVASRKTGISPSGIHQAAKNGTRAGGFKWSYA